MIFWQIIPRMGKQVADTNSKWEHIFSMYLLLKLGIIIFFLMFSRNWAASSSSLNCHFSYYQRNLASFHVSIKLFVNCLSSTSIYLLVYSSPNTTFFKVLEVYNIFYNLVDQIPFRFLFQNYFSYFCTFTFPDKFESQLDKFHKKFSWGFCCHQHCIYKLILGEFMGLQYIEFSNQKHG